MARRIRILIVDDSALYRQAIRNVLSELPDIDIVGVAKDGREALEQIDSLRPDLLSLDVQMPNMDGIEVLRRLNERYRPPRALMVSSLTSQGAQATTDALMEGAFDFILKPSGREVGDNREALARAFREKLAAFRQNLESADVAAATPARSATRGTSATPEHGAGCQAVLIGTSTGGPAALKKVLPRLPANLAAPVIVVQHMPEGFTASLARRLDSLSELQVVEADEGDVVQSGRVLLAPGGRQMRLVREGADVRTRLSDDVSVGHCRPSVDVMFASAASAYAGGVLGIIMTGMGRDGVEGCSEIKRQGGVVFAQHENGCVVYGMPKAAIEADLTDRILPLGRIGPAIVRHVKRSKHSASEG